MFIEQLPGSKSLERDGDLSINNVERTPVLIKLMF